MLLVLHLDVFCFPPAASSLARISVSLPESLLNPQISTILDALPGRFLALPLTSRNFPFFGMTCDSRDENPCFLRLNNRPQPRILLLSSASCSWFPFRQSCANEETLGPEAYLRTPLQAPFRPRDVGNSAMTEETTLISPSLTRQFFSTLISGSLATLHAAPVPSLCLARFRLSVPARALPIDSLPQRSPPDSEFT